MRRPTCATVLACVLSFSGATRAEGDPAAAEALFREGRRLAGSGQYELACPKFEESHRLDPGAGTLINLADCYERLGKVASAWDKWQQALRMLSGSDERRPPVLRRAAAIESRLPRLTLRLAEDAPEEARVLRDGVVLGAAALGVSLPVDPGAHVVEVSAPGRAPRTYRVELEEGEAETLDLEPGAVEPAPASREQTPPRRVVVRADRREPAPPPTPPESPVPGYVVAGAGAAGLVVGMVTGILALGKKSTMESDCKLVDGQVRCGPSGMDAASAGRTLATVSNVAFATGVVGLGVGGYLIFSGRSAPPSSVEASSGPAVRVGITGAF